MKRSLAFGEFRLDVAERQLVCKGEVVPLTPKVFDALILLVENAGHLVEKDEFKKRLWPDTFVGDDALAQNISLLRKAIGDGNESSALIVTVPRRGYRFVGIVREVVESLQGAEGKNSRLTEQTTAERLSTQNFLQKQLESREHETLGQALGERSEAAREVSAVARSTSSGLRPSGMRLVVVAIGAGLLAGILTYALLSPTPLPRVVRTTQVTNSGRADPWGRMLTDGARIYFLEREGDHWNLVQTSVSRGEPQIISVPFRNTVLLDISTDHAEFLIGQFPYRGTLMPLWIWPVQGGPPVRVGEIKAYDAAWGPHDRQIVYAEHDGVYLADRNGSNARKLASTESPPGMFAWSPDGKRLRFSVFPEGIESSSIWEMNSDGTNLHRMLAGWNDPPGECCGRWAPDGSLFFFSARHAGTADIWVLRERESIFRGSAREPIRLTAGPGDFEGSPVTSSDVRRLYVFKRDLKSDMVRYDQKIRQFRPILSGTHADSSSYSRDGEWIAYVTVPDSTLWRMKRDGSLRFRLTSPPIRAQSPAWSPNGKYIAFTNRTSNCLNKLYLVPAEGGSFKELFPHDCEQFDPAWSPDGKLLSFARADKSLPGKAATVSIQVLDLLTSQVSTLSGSQGMRSPSWSPDGRFVAALTEDLQKLMLLDLRTQRWKELAEGTLLSGALKWSPDAKSLYFQDLLATNEAVYRVRLSDHKREQVASFEVFLRAGISRCGFVDLAPDGSLIAVLLRNHADIYALDLDLP
jgi:Tol biopolymer transport system component/DNA-binding winged helix-turn-helix (wHTH) protein